MTHMQFKWFPNTGHEAWFLYTSFEYNESFTFTSVACQVAIAVMTPVACLACHARLAHTLPPQLLTYCVWQAANAVTITPYKICKYHQT